MDNATVWWEWCGDLDKGKAVYAKRFQQSPPIPIERKRGKATVYCFPLPASMAHVEEEPESVKQFNLWQGDL